MTWPVRMGRFGWLWLTLFSFDENDNLNYFIHFLLSLAFTKPENILIFHSIFKSFLEMLFHHRNIRLLRRALSQIYCCNKQITSAAISLGNAKDQRGILLSQNEGLFY